jgi:RimJ/RimL family protein N-acetyltransferase
MTTAGAAIPVIETERLILRGPCAADLDACASMWGDPAVTRFIGGRPLTREESWARILRYVGHWALLGFGYWAVEERGTGRYVGEIGFAEFKREAKPSFEGTPEMGWVLAPWSHGKGFATEAVRAALAWGEATLPSRRTVCMIESGHVASIHVARKCGYVDFGSTAYRGETLLMFERG